MALESPDVDLQCAKVPLKSFQTVTEKRFKMSKSTVGGVFFIFSKIKLKITNQKLENSNYHHVLTGL